MALSDLAVFSEWVYGSQVEVLQQQVDLFNAASNGTISLSTAAHVGDYSDRAFWEYTDNLIRRRNPYSDADVAPVSMAHLVDTMVKVASGTPPVKMNPADLAWIQRDPQEYAIVLGQQLAVETMADMLNVSITALIAALSNDSEVIYDGKSADVDTFNPRMMNQGAKKFGDQANKLQAWVLHSTPWFDMIDNNLQNTERLFEYGTVRINADTAGRPFIMTDCPALVTEGDPGADPATTDTYHNLGLTANAVSIEQNGDFNDNFENSNGKENIQRTYQAEWSYELGVKGYAWNKSGGGKAPNDAAIASSANWNRIATSHKDLAGVIVNSA